MFAFAVQVPTEELSALRTTPYFIVAVWESGDHGIVIRSKLEWLQNAYTQSCMQAT